MQGFVELPWPNEGVYICYPPFEEEVDKINCIMNDVVIQCNLLLFSHDLVFPFVSNTVQQSKEGSWEPYIKYID